MSTNKDLKAYIRIDGSGRDVPGSLVLRTRMPGNGKWRQILADQCCNPVVGPTTTTTTTASGVPLQGSRGSESGGGEVCFAIQFFSDIWMVLATPNVIAIGDTIYSDAGGTIPAFGDGVSYRKIITPGGVVEFAVQYDANGVVTDSLPC